MSELRSPQSAVRSPKNKNVSIFILIDALGWHYIKDRPFLADSAPFKRPVKSVLGFSSGVIPSILTGKMPHEHKHWSLYYRDPVNSPFRWTKWILWLPKAILRTRLARKVIEEISKRGMGYTGYFETYLIPVEHLHRYDISENRNIYVPGGMRRGSSIFDELNGKGIDYASLTYPLKDSEIFEKAIEGIRSSDKQFYFLYCSELDSFLHGSCKDAKAVNEKIDYYEERVRALYRAAKERFQEVDLHVFSDHGMAPVDQAYDLTSEIEALGFAIGKDYVPFYDSTMARFWFFNDMARQKIARALQDKEYGRILSEEELSRYGVNFADDQYGQLIFLMNTGTVIVPSYMGNRMPEGMHGYDVRDSAMDAVLVSNVEVGTDMQDVRGIFGLMSGAVGAKGKHE